MIEQAIIGIFLLWVAWRVVKAVDYNKKVINKEE